MITLDSSVGNLARVGERNRTYLETLGIETCQDLIFYFPFRFDDYSKVVRISELKQNMTATVEGVIEMMNNRRSPFKKKILTEAIVSDGTGQVKVVWFNQPFLIKNLKAGDRVSLSGRTSENFYDLTIVSPVYEKIRTDGPRLHTGRLVPVYSLTRGLHEKHFRLIVAEALERCLRFVPEWLPAELVASEKLVGIHEALSNIHFPESPESLVRARERLSFDEFLTYQLIGKNIRREFAAQEAPAIAFWENESKEWIAALPFALSEKQRKSAWEIVSDMQREHPMNRLLEGDVGSGKTVVAALTMLNAALSEYQTAFMAPTEILASQHFATLSRLFARSELSVCLLTSKQCKVSHGSARSQMKEDQHLRNGAGVDPLSSSSHGCTRSEVLELVAKGAIDIVIGTHALIQPDVTFANLGLVIVDEQHRFGVRQRQLLREKRTDGKTPHLLSMTATPIPRSLALVMYGDLDVSIIDELPTGRKKIITKIVPASYREWTYDFIKKQIAHGRQAFVVCPLVSPSDAFGAKSVKEEAARLSSEVFADVPIGMLHGKMKAEEKERVMREMADGTLKILVASSVVEVGIDVPNATVMLVEGAERFGLAQLHQFRGRVGRSAFQSYCFLAPSDPSKENLERLRALTTSASGFALAEKDLKFRGPGEIYGHQQSGLPQLKIADLFDVALLRRTGTLAEKIASDPNAYPTVTNRLEKLRRDVHFE